MLELLEERENLEQVTGKEITNEDIALFQETVAKPFISHLKNILSRFASSG